MSIQFTDLPSEIIWTTAKYLPSKTWSNSTLLEVTCMYVYKALHRNKGPADRPKAVVIKTTPRGWNFISSFGPKFQEVTDYQFHDGHGNQWVTLLPPCKYIPQDLPIITDFGELLYPKLRATYEQFQAYLKELQDDN